VSPDLGNNTVEGGSGDQPLFTKARRLRAGGAHAGR
jgi:asparagine synthetase B (glutamine-hydrolysing)